LKIPGSASVPAGKTDHVDRVRAQWRTARPDLDTSPIAVVARVGRLAAYFDQAVNALLCEYGLTRSSWDILASLRRIGVPYELSPTELYRGLMRSSGWMTNRLNELESAGLVERRSDPGDGRGVLVRLTRKGVRLVDKIAPRHLENEARLLSQLSAREREGLAELLRALLRPREEEHPKPPLEGRRSKSRRPA
jgi:DNA-binding MarR family transcriptional regulator